MKSVILANRDNCREVEEEAKYDFTVHVLEYIEIPAEHLSECLPKGGFKKFSAKHKIKLRKLLNSYLVSIVDNRDGELKIFVDKDLVAHWRKSKFVLKRDQNELIRENQLYVEIHIDYWIISEGEK